VLSERGRLLRSSLSLCATLIFYFGHTAPSISNKLVLAKLLPQANRMLGWSDLRQSAVDEMSWDDLDDAHYESAHVVKWRAYRRRFAQRCSPS